MKDVDPGDTGGIASKQDAGEALAQGVELLAEMQERFCAQDRWGVLLIFQEEVLVVRVHPGFLAGQRLPERLVTKNIWKDGGSHRSGSQPYAGRVVRRTSSTGPPTVKW